MIDITSRVYKVMRVAMMADTYSFIEGYFTNVGILQIPAGFRAEVEGLETPRPCRAARSMNAASVASLSLLPMSECCSRITVAQGDMMSASIYRKFVSLTPLKDESVASLNVC